MTALMACAYGRPNPRDVPEPETPITIELNIPKPPGVMRTESTGGTLPDNSMEQHMGQDQGGEQSRTELRRDLAYAQIQNAFARVFQSIGLDPYPVSAGDKPETLARSLAERIERMRRFVNEVRREQEEFAELIARETGKPLWEAKTEVEAVIGKVTRPYHPQGSAAPGQSSSPDRSRDDKKKSLFDRLFGG